jgi:hypothetical protein
MGDQEGAPCLVIGCLLTVALVVVLFVDGLWVNPETQWLLVVNGTDHDLMVFIGKNEPVVIEPSRHVMEYFQSDTPTRVTVRVFYAPNQSVHGMAMRTFEFLHEGPPAPMGTIPESRDEIIQAGMEYSWVVKTADFNK